ncbi:MAG TPA: hypothetical protein VMM76_17925 [Pirellulaceae bacterium]|nr:hypothetical protein [Pirellulaceae bacterium]
MNTPLFQFSFLCVVALVNLCLGFAIASRLGFGPSLAVLFGLEPTAPRLQADSPDRETTADKTEEPVADEAL